MSIFTRSYHTAMCIGALNSNQIKLARHHFDKIRSGDSSSSRVVALGARLSLLENDTPSARPQLERAITLAENKSGDAAGYVVHYCRYFLELIDRSGQHEEQRLLALRLKPGRLYWRTLPLPSREITLAEIDLMNKGGNFTIH